jgi:hypothetical protein
LGTECASERFSRIFGQTLLTVHNATLHVERPGMLDAINTQTAQIAWQQAIHGESETSDIFPLPHVTASPLIVSAGHYVGRYNAATGKQEWLKPSLTGTGGINALAESNALMN